MSNGTKIRGTCGSTAMSNQAYKRSWREKVEPATSDLGERPETKKGCRASRRYYLMSFRGMGKSIQNDEAPDPRPTPRPILWMSFQPAIPGRGALQHCPPLLHQPTASMPYSFLTRRELVLWRLWRRQARRSMHKQTRKYNGPRIHTVMDQFSVQMMGGGRAPSRNAHAPPLSEERRTPRNESTFDENAVTD